MDKALHFLVSFSESYDITHAIELFFDDVLEDEVYKKLEVGDRRDVSFENVTVMNTYEIKVHITFSRTFSKGLVSKIVQDWCDPNKNKLSHLWLSLTDIAVLENSGKLCHSDVNVKEIAFGTLVEPQQFMQHYNYKNNTNEKEISGTFIHSQRKCMIYTCLIHTQKSCRQKNVVHNKFQLFYDSIRRVIVKYVPNSDLVHIFFQLLYLPSLYVSKNQNAQNENYSVNAVILACDQEYQEKHWDRALDFGCQCNNSFFRSKTVGKCPIFKITVPKKHKTHEIVERLMQRCPPSTIFNFANIKTVPLSSSEDFKRFPLKQMLLNQYSQQERDDLIFNLSYAWKTIMSRSEELEDQINYKNSVDKQKNHWKNLCDVLDSFVKTNHEALIYSLYDISDLITKGILFDFSSTLGKLFHYHCKLKPKDGLPEGMCLLRRIILTPSREIYLPPTEHFDNRVIREYGSEFLLRISVQDDDFSKLTFAIQHTYYKNHFMEHVFRKFLIEGISIGPRDYKLLASSNSQLREHGLYMYAKDHKGNTAESIRVWMGDFSGIKNVAKYMARMGQCFSTSGEGVQITIGKKEVFEIEDVKTRDGTFTFSDGVGKLSTELAEEVRSKFATENDLIFSGREYLYDPSAFQIRFKGCKGMVAECPVLLGRKIEIRPSMNKFPCDTSDKLEIVKISAPRAVFLNRPLISILENLGISESVFLDLQKKMVFNLTDSLIYEEKACKMLRNNTGLDFPFRELSNMGVSITQEPFFRSLLLSVYRSMIEKLKVKARIAIPPKYGRNMLGIMDETNTLKYGEVFVQYSVQVGNIKSKTKTLLGTVVVTKNPCMHPGDVRKFKAVWVEELKHIKDCIVFPAEGPRPHPDEMAGSDLDGDEYAVIWEPRLIFERENHEAMNYPPNEEVKLNRPIVVSDIVDFFCRYIKDDQIGLMANAHLAISDYDPEGIFSQVCMRIAQKYPQALDFAKSGTTCTLDSSERPRCYPDFMGKGCRNNSYKSVKALGLLYRVIRNLEASVSNIDDELSIKPDPKFDYPGWQEFEKLAEDRKLAYNNRVQNIFKKYGLRSEAEVLTGNIRSMNEYYTNKYDMENIGSLSKKYFIDLMKRFRRKFERDAGLDETIKMKMASAMYMVTYRNPTEKILSFPWIVTNELLKIQTRNNGYESLESKNAFIDTSNKRLIENFLPRNIESCLCVSILENFVKEWINSSALILATSAENVFCNHCLKRIIETFRENNYCCSYTGDHCSCHKACSPMSLILSCLKYYASDISSDLGQCGKPLGTGKHCEGFRDMNLHSEALKTYAAVAITQNLYYLGLAQGPAPNSYSSANEEGDPIRVPVTNAFEDILTGNVDNVCKILQKLSGVKKVHIDGSSEKRGYYILVHSIGRAFQRWNLEELIMDPKCPEIIRSRINQ